jgi:hypothetical protein
MQEAGARSLRADEQPLTSAPEPGDREAVLLAWERKIEQEERRSGARRFAREEAQDAPAGEDSPAEAPRRFAGDEPTEPARARFERAEPTEPARGRFERDPAPRGHERDAQPAAPRRRRQPRFERHGAPAPRLAPAPEPAPERPVRVAAPIDEPPPLRPAAPSAPRGSSLRRTVTITGQPVPARRRATAVERHLAVQPDRIALWAFLLGLFLVAVAAGTAQAG